MADIFWPAPLPIATAPTNVVILVSPEGGPWTCARYNPHLKKWVAYTEVDPVTVDLNTVSPPAWWLPAPPVAEDVPVAQLDRADAS